eukprot:sb/3478810/
MEREARTDNEKTSKMSKTEMVATEKAVEYSEAPYKPKNFNTILSRVRKRGESRVAMDTLGGDTLKLGALVHISTSRNTLKFEVRSFAEKFEVSRKPIFG